MELEAGPNPLLLTRGGAPYLSTAGHNIVLYSTDTKTQRFLPCSVESDGITAFALSKSKKYLAVAERGEKAILTIYNIQEMKRRKVGSRPPAPRAAPLGRDRRLPRRCSSPPRPARPSTFTSPSAPMTSTSSPRVVTPSGTRCSGSGRRTRSCSPSEPATSRAARSTR